jgi:hypothetical protein
MKEGASEVRTLKFIATMVVDEQRYATLDVIETIISTILNPKSP